MEKDKKKLRRLFTAKRNALLPEQRRCFDEDIRRNICSLPVFCQCSAVAAFCAFGAEPDVLPCLKNKRLFLPRFAAEQQKYELVEIRDLEKDLAIGRYGIAEPHSGLPAADRDFIRHEVLFLVPAVAFDRSGARLGRGGGYYDRMLESVTKPPVGVAYSCQIGEDLPRGRWDVPMKWVVTECEVIMCEEKHRAFPE